MHFPLKGVIASAIRHAGLDPVAIGLILFFIALIGLFIIGTLVYYGKSLKNYKMIIAMVIFSLMLGFSSDMLLSLLF